MELEAQLEKQRLEAEVRMAELKAGAQDELCEPANGNGEGLMLRAPQLSLIHISEPTRPY